jgi:hypothetical protein
MATVDRIKQMQQEPESSSPAISVSPARMPETASDPISGSADEPQSGVHHEHGVPHWLVRVELFLRVMLRMYIGLAVCYAPWSRTFWDQNPIFLQFPALGHILGNGAVRGIVSGIGLLNLWIAFHDAIRHRDG